MKKFTLILLLLPAVFISCSEDESAELKKSSNESPSIVKVDFSSVRDGSNAYILAATTEVSVPDERAVKSLTMFRESASIGSYLENIKTGTYKFYNTSAMEHKGKRYFFVFKMSDNTEVKSDFYTVP